MEEEKHPGENKEALEGIKHFMLQFINTKKIGPCKEHDKNCNNKLTSTVELLLGRGLKQILVQKVGQDGIQAVLIIDEIGHVTALNCPNTETMFNRSQWRVFNIEASESLIDMYNTDSFNKIEFLVCKLPKQKPVKPAPIH